MIAWDPARAPSPYAAAGDTLTERQVGHIRHIENLSLQPPGDWAHMGTRMHGQEDFGSYRFQLAFMAYALGLAHRHRLPNAPGAFRATFDRLITKLLHPDVWLYWRNVSQGGHALNAHLRPRLSEQWNPVECDNIMYSAYVQSLTLMYATLFGDMKYAAPESIVLEHASFFWGDGPKRFAYDQNSLNDHLYWKMVESGYLGIACEPNCVFQICNQPAILGFRLHDMLTGGSRATEVIEGYRRTWDEFGRVGDNGHFNMMVLEDSRMVIPNGSGGAWADGWLGALMNMWNRDFVRRQYRGQLADLLIPGVDGAAAVKLTPVPSHGGLTLDYDTGDFGFVAIWASEMGDAETLASLIRHADRHMNPTWERGGLYYPREDRRHDAAGRPIRVEPITGNALVAYAALNVPDGLWTLFNHPWHPGHFDEPLITAVSDTIDVLAARYDPTAERLDFTLARRTDRAGPARLTIANVAEGWTIAGPEASTPLALRRVDGGIEVELDVGATSRFVLERAIAK